MMMSFLSIDGLPSKLIELTNNLLAYVVLRMMTKVGELHFIL